MKDKLKRFTVFAFKEIICFLCFVGFMFFLRALILSRMMIFQVIAAVLFLGLFVMGCAGAVIVVLSFIRKRNTKSGAGAPDQEVLQE